MKLILLALAFVSIISADELQRIESIVGDIEKLRTGHEQCKEKLKSKKMDNPSEEIATSTAKHNEVEMGCKLQEEQVEKYKLLLQEEKDKTISLPQKNDSNTTVVAKVAKEKSVSMKITKLQEKPEIEKITPFKATTFRLKKDGYIYDYPNKNRVEKWEKNRSFTSTQGTLKWINITGFFVNKQWQKATNSIWIQKSDIIEKIIRD